MSNDYYNHTNPLARHTLASAQALNTIFEAIATGFDKLHDPDDISRGRTTFAVDTGVADALVVAMPKTMTAYENGSSIVVGVAATNTGACTINVDGLGARAIKMPDGANPSPGDLAAGDIVQLTYDASAVSWILTTPYRLIALINNLRDVVIGSYANDAAADASGFTIADGTFYFKTTAPKGLRLRSDGAWVDAVLDASGALLAANNLDDVADAATARDNLGVSLVEKPTNVTPANAGTVSVSGPTLTGSAYRSLYGKTKAAGQWQVSIVSDFSSTVVDTGDVSGTAVAYTVPIQTLSESTTYYWRCRYKDDGGVYSAWSDGTSFITSALFTPSGEVAKIVASDAAANDEFGRAVAIDGDYVVVGVPDEGGQGAVYVYERDGSGSWSQMQKFTSSDIQSGDEFGQSVAIDGDYIVVGAPMEDTGGTSAGAVYVFELSGGTWSQMQKIQPSDISAGDQAGSSVAIDGTTLVFGSLQKDNQRGGAYVYDLSGGTWSETAILEASDRQASDQFGINVDISGNYIIVAAHEEDTTASAAGSCYFFELDGTWSEMQKVQASDVAANRRIGQNGVAIDGNYAAITNGVDDQVYIFQLSGGTWSEVEIVTPGGGLDSNGFASSVAMDEPFLVVGATLAHSETTADVGAVYVYQHDGAGTWTQVGRFTASDEALNDEFGFSVGIFENRVVIGARYEDAGGSNAGAAYIFE